MGELNIFNLEHFNTKHNCEIYVETGTGIGVCLSHMLKYKFKKYYSIDIDGDLIAVGEQTSDIIDENVPDIDIDEILGINQQISPPQVNISLPQVTPVRVSDPLRQEQQDRIEFAERLFRRPVI